MRNRTFCLILGTVLAIAIVGSVTTVPVAAQADQYDFVVITHSATISFWVPLVKGAQDAARAISLAEGVNITVRHLGPHLFNVEEQVSIMENAIQSGVDGIIATLPDPNAFDAPVQQALDRGIPVVATNTDDTSGDNPRLAYVGQNDITAGRSLGEEIVKRVGTSGKVAIGLEDLGHPSLQDRLAGVRQVLDQTDITYEVLHTTADLTQAVATFESFLLANPDAKGIFSVDATGTTAQGTVIRNLGLQGRVVSGGWDLVPGTLQNIQDGYTQFTVDQNPYLQGYYPVVGLYLYLRYGIAPSNIDTGASIVDASNVNDVLSLAEQGYR
ncbi:substrate-binding domain-containing protein [Limnochorda pilosa]|uniref:ABC sugar transport periplasmic component n=1 Tax=Limnochorda pilosa TaxID=1555112 RepID=A0A0K2SLG0_LIMPI|nr:substrate-binding domain-containing protein [Limnochorda pilosa]BAS27958.1 ABC sugar transport periplasmic component [Limnochorda pilosa]